MDPASGERGAGKGAAALVPASAHSDPGARQRSGCRPGFPAPRVKLQKTTMGLYFSILAVESEMVYERRGRIQRKAGIHPQWHHHPDAVRVPESVFSRFSDAFRMAHPGFNYYGPTEYKDQETARLCTELRAGTWAETTVDTQVETERVVREILAVAERALANRQSLLVLGI